MVCLDFSNFHFNLSTTFSYVEWQRAIDLPVVVNGGAILCVEVSWKLCLSAVLHPIFSLRFHVT